mmetsp:Transcript_28826/g.45207  ORF Transcript_28826/g.45207 Transcript_28826/m.45207 type:complete len:575 (-) Transcript_28826:409-2133(-)
MIGDWPLPETEVELNISAPGVSQSGEASEIAIETNGLPWNGFYYLIKRDGSEEAGLNDSFFWTSVVVFRRHDVEWIGVSGYAADSLYSVTRYHPHVNQAEVPGTGIFTSFDLRDLGQCQLMFRRELLQTGSGSTQLLIGLAIIALAAGGKRHMWKVKCCLCVSFMPIVFAGFWVIVEQEESFNIRSSLLLLSLAVLTIMRLVLLEKQLVLHFTLWLLLVSAWTVFRMLETQNPVQTAALYVWIAVVALPGAILGTLAIRRWQIIEGSGALMSKDADMYSRALGQFIKHDAEEMAVLEQLVDQTVPCHPTRLRQTLCLPEQPGGRSGASPFTSFGIPVKRQSASVKALLGLKGGKNMNSGHDSWQEDSTEVQTAYSDGYFETQVVQALNADQLYSAGLFTHLLLRRFCQKLAFRNNGFFPAACEERMISWRDACNDTSLRHRIIWPPVKSPGRVVEKVLRTYHGDFSRTLDIARCMIIFRYVADLTSCFEAILKEPNVELLRVKNKLKFDTDLPGGEVTTFRDLHMNLRLHTQEAYTMGVQGHICELQLVPAQVFKVKSEGGHKNYIQYRNLRGA